MRTRMLRLIGLVAAALLLALVAGPVLVMAQGKTVPTVAPNEGVPGVRFVFMAAGFKGAVPAEDADRGSGEEVSYWINLPDGSMIDMEERTKESDYGNLLKPMRAQANGHGEVTIRWRAPLDAVPGAYSMVIHGLKSDTEVMIPFQILPAGSQTVVQANVTPRSGAAGAAFQFVATGFNAASADRGKPDVTGEKVSYWFNTPDGSIIATEERSSESDYGNTTKPLRHYADDEGVVNLVWQSPESLRSGIYSVVFHGLDSQHEVVMFFTIK